MKNNDKGKAHCKLAGEHIFEDDIEAWTMTCKRCGYHVDVRDEARRRINAMFGVSAVWMVGEKDE